MKSQTATATVVPSRKLVCCAVQEEEYCFDLSDVSSITRAHQIVPCTDQEEGLSVGVPIGQRELIGLIGWIGTQQTKLPVYDLAQRLQPGSQPTPETAREGFVVVLKTSPSYAVRVDRITGNIALPLTQVTALPPIVVAKPEACFKDIAQVAEKWILCLDVNRLRPGTRECFRPATVPSLTTEATCFASHAEKKRCPASPQILIFLSATQLEASADTMPLFFGLSIMQSQEVVKLTKIIPVPNAPSYVYGIINWHNLPVPIIDLKARLGLTTTIAQPHLLDPQSRLLIVRAAQSAGLLGIPVTPEIKTFRLPIPYQPLQQPLALATDLVKGVFELGKLPFVIPDLDAILTRNFALKLK